MSDLLADGHLLYVRHYWVFTSCLAFLVCNFQSPTAPILEVTSSVLTSPYQTNRTIPGLPLPKPRLQAPHPTTSLTPLNPSSCDLHIPPLPPPQLWRPCPAFLPTLLPARRIHFRVHLPVEDRTTGGHAA